ncbi:hypothetical protein B0H67DRAFT_593716 [Lasiosphaeris hirsuta]|uniref:Uncharacterized protein n=1 Tax=Lasiosphaeris hirsuta TaxID=260670 RepID=A0AA39ZXB7_9PEZI|nr:hypothetical protein B0H67DRAFT_593716 [Lasiosphaeris hirsuta]
MDLGGVGRPFGGSGPMKPRSKTLYQGHFDPNELCYRLNMVLAQQKAHADRKRRALETPGNASRHDGAGRPQEPPGQPEPSPSRVTATSALQSHRGPSDTSTDLVTELKRSRSTKQQRQSKAAAAHADAAGEAAEYHHIPQEAAKQFARTMTVEVMRDNNTQVHELSKRALKLHMDGGRTIRQVGATTADMAPAELTQTLRYSQERQNKVLDRNQFQRARALEEAAQHDIEREREYGPLRSRHTFQCEISRITPDNYHNQAGYEKRRNSTGGVAADLLLSGGHSGVANEPMRRTLITMEPLLDAVEDATPPPDDLPGLVSVAARREHACADWTQTDETPRGHSSGRQKLLLSPLLRNTASLWGLRGRLGSKGGQDKEGSPQQEHEQVPKSPRASFFAKLLR